MDIKFNFKRKRKIRLQYSGEKSLTPCSDVVPCNCSCDERGRERLPRSGREDAPRGVLRRLFPFLRSRKTKQSTFSLNSSNRNKSTQSALCRDLDERDRPSRSEEKQCNNSGRVPFNQTEYSKNSSVSSPNLLYVDGVSYDSIAEAENVSVNCPRGSFRRSRASLVFPVSQIQSPASEFVILQQSNSETELRKSGNLNAKILDNSSQFSSLADFCGSCKKGNEAAKHCFHTQEGDKKKQSFYRTDDGRSPHPGRRALDTFDTFSSPALFEENNAIEIDDRKTKINNIVGSHDSQHDLEKNIAFSQNNLKNEDEDTVFMAFDTQNSVRSENKRLMRFVSCPFMLDMGHAQNQNALNIPLRGDSKPYSSHKRPYSVHESVLSLNFKPNHIGINVDQEKEDDGEQDSPPEDDLSLPSKDLPLAFGEALWDYSAEQKTQLSFRAGDTIAIYFMSKKKWWWGTAGDTKGWFPSTHLRLTIDQEVKTDLREPQLGSLNAFSLLGIQTPHRTKNEVRSRCILELMTSEKDYVKTLKDVTEGYLKTSRKRLDLFSPDDVAIIFCNLERILKFHETFFHELRDRVSNGNVFDSRVGDLFILHKADFDLYSEYCNNHPNACTRLFQLQKEKKYTVFFESCRLLQKMISLSLDAFLLTPVQKICKYHLQLNELLKHTPVEHSDYSQLQMAVTVMREVASSINERKKKFEDLNSIAEWQLNVDLWQGEDVLEICSERVKAGPVESLFGGKRQNVHLSLFDHLLILCRMDSGKKPQQLVYVNRFNLDEARVDILGNTGGVKASNVIRITDFTQNITCWLNTKSKEEMEEWQNAFRMERQLVKSQSENGSTLSMSIRRAAMESARLKRQLESAKRHRRRKSFTDPFQEFGSNVIRRSLRLRRTQSLRDKRFFKAN